MATGMAAVRLGKILNKIFSSEIILCKVKWHLKKEKNKVVRPFLTAEHLNDPEAERITDFVL